ncbi:hypothetical protein [Isoptericola cucumis]|uniref:Uncharacterized protein n=1 Tax=Isoptericola cucumis TaxID=1776856 RepID=A0ABQ2AZL3_9MICO|nr:hypothetical protein [Isoptericola cucumis]GGI04235.1 hypothetical protein GCM10007368_00130 [Isoptericola cucumis]
MLATVVLLCGVGVLGGYGLGLGVDAVRGILPGSDPGLPADKAAPPDPIDLTGPATACGADGVDVGLSVASPAVTLGDPQVFSVRVTNTGRVPCLIDGSEASRTVTVTDPSGKERVWSSADCAEGETMLLLGPEDVAPHDVRWGTERSAPGCKGEQPALEPGTYQARAELADVPGSRTAPVTFTVAEPEPDPAASPEGDGPEGTADAEKGDDGKAGGAEKDTAEKDGAAKSDAATTDATTDGGDGA